MEDSQKLVLQDGITKVLQHMINHNANSPVISSRFHSHSAPAMTIGAYVERIVKYTRCSCEALVGALMFLQYHVTFSGHCLTIFNVHRTLITSVVLSAKSRDDEYYTNTYYAKIGGIPASELKTLELDYINLMEWDCWLDRDAFDETVAMLVELATSSPTTEDIAQAVGFWEEKQARFARSRRDLVRSAVAADVEIEAKKAAANGFVSGGSFGSSVASPTSATAGNGGGMFGSGSAGSGTQQHLERLAFGSGGGSATMGAPSNSNGSSNTNAYKDPFNHSGTSNASASNSNLVVTAPCFYPKGMRAPGTAAGTTAAVAANSATGAAPKNLGVNPYQQQQQTSESSVNPFAAGGRGGLNPYGNNNTNTNSAANNRNPFANAAAQQNGGNGFGLLNRTAATPSGTRGITGKSSMFPSAPQQPMSYNPTTMSSNDQQQQPRTPTSDNATNNKPSSWAAVVNTNTSRASSGNTNTNTNNGGLLLGVPGGRNNTDSPNASTSPTVMPQGAPGFNNSSNPYGVSSSSANNKTASPNNNNTSYLQTASPGSHNAFAQQQTSASSNGRLLTKHRFASSDNITQRTPESNRYSIVGVNTNQHPNSYHFYNQQQQQNSSSSSSKPSSTRKNRGGGNAGGGHASNNNGLSSGNDTGKDSSTSNNNLTNPLAASNSSNTANGGGAQQQQGGGSSPGIKLSTADTASSPSAAAANAHNNSSNSIDVVAAESAHCGGDDYDDAGGDEDNSSPLGRAGSKRGAMGRQMSGKKREVPSHWQEER